MRLIPATIRRSAVFVLCLLVLYVEQRAAPAEKKNSPGQAPQARPARPRLVGHRGLFRHAPENTLASFAACADLRLGFELDVRRTRDGRLVCLHDADVKRTTDGQGKVAEFTLAELRRLDAGRWFDPVFAGQRVPTLEEVFILLKEKGGGEILVALDVKIEDESLATDVVQLAKKHGVLGQVVFIGLTITEPALRQKLRAADAKTPVAVLAATAEQLPLVLKDTNADWVYLRFVPTAQQVDLIHHAGRRVFLSGPLVGGQEPAAWRTALEAGVDAILTDYPLECREFWRGPKAP